MVSPEFGIPPRNSRVDKIADLELRLHTESADCKQDAGGYLVTGDRAALRVVPLTPDNVKMDAADVPARGSHARSAGLFTIRFTNHALQWQNALALSWVPVGQEAKQVSLAKDGRTWTFSIAGKKLVFDWDKGSAVLQP
jgi:hypothetical protein